MSQKAAERDTEHGSLRLTTQASAGRKNRWHPSSMTVTWESRRWRGREHPAPHVQVQSGRN